MSDLDTVAARLANRNFLAYVDTPSAKTTLEGILSEEQLPYLERFRAAYKISGDTDLKARSIRSLTEKVKGELQSLKAEAAGASFNTHLSFIKFLCKEGETSLVRYLGLMMQSPGISGEDHIDALTLVYQYGDDVEKQSVLNNLVGLAIEKNPQNLLHSARAAAKLIELSKGHMSRMNLGIVCLYKTAGDVRSFSIILGTLLLYCSESTYRRSQLLANALAAVEGQKNNQGRIDLNMATYMLEAHGSELDEDYMRLLLSTVIPSIKWHSQQDERDEEILAATIHKVLECVRYKNVYNTAFKEIAAISEAVPSCKELIRSALAAHNRSPYPRNYV